MRSSSNVGIWQVNAFAERPFTGNPAAVCILDHFPSDGWMQKIAAEMNLSETAFVVPSDDANAFELRWFTPVTEVDLCGHATLATVHTLFEQGRVDPSLPVRFQTRSGELACHRTGDRFTLDFPATPANTTVDASVEPSLLLALGLKEASVLRNQFDYLVIVNDEETIVDLRPDFNALASVETRGVVVTASSTRPGVDFVSRFFAPRCGIAEDPVTGSAHCCLAPYWAERLKKNSLVGYQASHRGGTVECEVVGDRVRLTGRAVTVLEGHLLVDVD